MGYIYKITNNVNNKVYIGQTKQDPEKRWKGHKASINKRKHCPLLCKAFNKYGLDKFKFEVIVICFDDALNKMEEYYIQKYNSFGKDGYNATKGGEPGGHFKGHKHTETAVNNMKEKLKNLYTSDERRKLHGTFVKEGLSKINLSEKIKAAIETKKKEGIPLFKNRIDGCKLQEETKQKIRESINKLYENNKINKSELREKIRASAIKRMGRPINQYMTDGQYVASYNYIKEAGDKTGIGHKAIQANLLGLSKTSGGFIWKYADKYKQEYYTIKSFFNKSR